MVYWSLPGKILGVSAYGTLSSYLIRVLSIAILGFIYYHLSPHISTYSLGNCGNELIIEPLGIGARAPFRTPSNFWVWLIYLLSVH